MMKTNVNTLCMKYKSKMIRNELFMRYDTKISLSRVVKLTKTHQKKKITIDIVYVI
jgi:hypothetical protein